MSWDIYGEPLTPGYCEVHPQIHQEYPCFVCQEFERAERERYEAMLAEQERAKTENIDGAGI